MISLVFPCLQCRRPGFDSWVGKIPWRRKWQPTSVSLAWKILRMRNLVCYPPWSHKESDTEQLHFLSFFSFSYNGNRLHVLNTEAGQHCNSEMDSGARSLNGSLTPTVPQFLFLRNGTNDSTSHKVAVRI